VREGAEAVRRDLLRRVGQELEDLGIVGSDTRLPDEPTMAERRRGRVRGTEPGFLTLVENDEGVLRWEIEAPGPAAASLPLRRRGRRVSDRPLPGRVVEELKFTPVYGSDVAAFLSALDRRLNAARGLHSLAPDGKATRAEPKADVRVLLFIHGTFSKGGGLVAGLRASEPGRDFLAKAFERYDQVLCFEHETLCVGPFLNALDLARAFRGRGPKALDVVCHSRGGLVARFWLEALGAAAEVPARVVFVGSPLLGTSLASPRRLRSGLDLLTNVAFTLEAATGLATPAVPLLAGVAGLLKLFSSVMALASKAPVLDAAVALVPGLLAQARYGQDGREFLKGNFELERLTAGLGEVPSGYSFVKADFEPEDPAWRFWRYFMEPVPLLQNLGADRIFAGEPNDLVVNTASMDALSPSLRGAGSALLDFGRTPTVHHLNYFRQPELGMFLAERLG